MTAARLVCAAQPQVAALPHVAQKISASLFQSCAMEWTLKRASKHGFERLLPRLHSREWPGFDQDCRGKRLDIYLCLPQDDWSDADFQLMMRCLPYEDEGDFFRLGQSSKAVDRAIARNDIASIEWLAQHRPHFFQTGHLNFALRLGRLEMAKWLVARFPKRHFQRPSKIFQHAGAQVGLDLVQWVTCEFEWDDESRLLAWIDDTMRVALRAGELKALELLYSIQKEYFENHQADSGARAQRTPIFSSSLMDEAAANGYLSIVE